MVNVRRLRYSCDGCGTSFTYRYPWMHGNLPLTMVLYTRICTELSGTGSVKSVALATHTTSGIVRGVLESIEFARPETLPKVMCFDEFKGDSGEWKPEDGRFTSNKYHCNIVDWKARKVVDILPTRVEADLRRYFRDYPASARENVEFLCCDMHEGFSNLCGSVFPNAVVCVDHFHVVKRLLRVLDEVRIRYQNELKEQLALDPDNEFLEKKRKSLQRSAKLLRTWEANIPKYWRKNTPAARRRLRSLFSAYPDLQEVYDSVQEFHVLSTQEITALRSADLSDWIDRSLNSEIPELRAAAETIDKWKKPLLNSFETGFSNGPVEGINNRIKVLKRNAHGFRNFENFRKRILLCCGCGRLSQTEHSIVSERRNTAAKSAGTAGSKAMKGDRP